MDALFGEETDGLKIVLIRDRVLACSRLAFWLLPGSAVAVGSDADSRTPAAIGRHRPGNGRQADGVSSSFAATMLEHRSSSRSDRVVSSRNIVRANRAAGKQVGPKRRLRVLRGAAMARTADPLAELADQCRA